MDFSLIFLGNFLDFFGRIFWGGFFGGFFWRIFGRIFLGGIICLHCHQLSYLNLKGIDAFVKILSQWRRKEGKNLDP